MVSTHNFTPFRPKTSHSESDPASGSRRVPKRSLSQIWSSKDLSDVKEWEGEAREGEHSHPDSKVFRGLNDVRSGIRTIFRRASTTGMKVPHLHYSTTRSRKNSRDNAGDSSHASGSHSFLRRASQSNADPEVSRGIGPLRFTFRRRAATSGPSGLEGRWNPSVPPMPPHILEPPYIPDDPTRGQAARASAATHRALQELKGQDWTSHTVTPVTPDRESAIWINDEDLVMTDACDESVVQRLDPVQYLPAELSGIIFENLDAASLANAERVSKAWNNIASSRHVWRQVLFSKYKPRSDFAPIPLQMGGCGVGEMLPDQDWKKMYHNRRKIDHRWELERPAAIYFSGHTDSVYCCQFDEDKIITGSRDRTIRVWDLHTYRCIKVIGGPASVPLPNTPKPLPPHRVHTVADVPSVNGTLEGNALYHIPEDYHSASILCLQFDKEIMVTGSSDFTCIVWDIKGYTPLYRLRKHAAGVLDVCFDNRYIVSCSKDMQIHVHRRDQPGALHRVLRGHRGPVNAVQMRGDLLVSASGDGIAKLWNIESGNCIREFQSKDRGLAAVEFSDDGKYVLAGGNDMVIYKFDANTGDLVLQYEGHEGLVRSLFLDTPNNRVLSGSYDQSMRVYDYTTGRVICKFKDWTTSWILSAKADYRRIVCTSQDGRVLLCDFGYGLDGVEMLSRGPARDGEKQQIPNRQQWCEGSLRLN